MINLFYKIGYSIVTLLVAALVGRAAVAETEIHRCSQPDGTVAFQEMPCEESSETVDDSEEPAAPAATDEFFDFVNPFDQPATAESAPEPEPVPVSQDRAECEKTTRDAIDAIDLEMRDTSYSREQGEAYLAELLELTRQLRACKAL